MPAFGAKTIISVISRYNAFTRMRPSLLSGFPTSRFAELGASKMAGNDGFGLSGGRQLPRRFFAMKGQ